ncbi:MAG: dihydroorotase [Phycisphaerales bacterium]|nr:dihydroorotase [Phycisphaerales bacterium]
MSAAITTQPILPNSYVIRGGRVIDPGNRLDQSADVAVVDGRIHRIGRELTVDHPSIDATGLLVCPGLIDIHVHFREPGGEHKETIETGCASAAAGGFTTVACMPNTNPAIDSPTVLDLIREKSRRAGLCRVLPIAAATEARRGLKPVDMTALKGRGAVAFSDDGDGIEDDAVMLRALEQVAAVGSVFIQHCEFKSISAGGVVHHGRVAEALGVPGYDPRAESAMLERDIGLVRRTGARYHVAHVSAAESVELVRRAKSDGLPVTAEVCPHHLALTADACLEWGANAKMSPPLRDAADVRACIDGLCDGAIDCIVTDHAPHTVDEKARGMRDAPCGIVGLETALAIVSDTLIQPQRLDWPAVIALFTTAPARVLGIAGGNLGVGQPADIVLVDPSMTWRIDVSRFASKCRNTPFDGWNVTGRPIVTILDGRLTYVAPGVTQRLETAAR